MPRPHDACASVDDASDRLVKRATRWPLPSGESDRDVRSVLRYRPPLTTKASLSGGLRFASSVSCCSGAKPRLPGRSRSSQGRGSEWRP